MDSKNIQIIRALQQNARLTNQQLAEAVNLSPSPCLRRVRLLEESGIIQGYTALVDAKAYGLPLTVFIRIKLAEHSEDIIGGFERRVAEVDAIQDCFLLTGDADYLLRVVVTDLDAYERFVRKVLQAIPGIGSIDTSIAYGTVKQSHVLPKPDGTDAF